MNKVGMSGENIKINTSRANLFGALHCLPLMFQIIALYSVRSS